MNRRSGMTLVEVVASIVILSLLTWAALPLLLRAYRTLYAPPPAAGIWELSLVANELLAESGFGDLKPDSGAAQVPWPNRPDLGTIRVSKASSESSLWLRFEWRDIAVARWFPRESDE